MLRPSGVRADPAIWLSRYQGLAAVLVAGAVVRGATLTEWWLNPDEGIYYSILTHGDWSAFWSEVASNAHPPLYYVLLRLLGTLTWDFLWFRVFTLVLGLAFIAVVWGVARRLGGRGATGEVAGLVAGLLVAFAPGMVELSQVIRPYTLQMTLLGGALLCLFHYLDDHGDPRREHADRDSRERRLGPGTLQPALGGYVGLVTLAVLTHYSSILALGAFGLVVLHDGWVKGFRRGRWHAAFTVHAVPAILLGLIYLLHLRSLATSELAGEALEGWLRPYMIDTPGDAWLAFMGFQHLLAPSWLRGATALLSLTVLPAAWVYRQRDLRPAVLLVAPVLVAGTAAAMGLYPFGSTRHSAWLAVFVAPVLGWVVAVALSGEGRRGWWGATALSLLLVVGGPLGTALGSDEAPWSPTDRVLRQGNVSQIIDVLHPTGHPELILMGAQTFYLLLPLYPADRAQAVRSQDGSLFHFSFGSRRILVSEGWDLTADPGQDSPAHLASVLERAAMSFPELAIRDQARAVLVAGGWRPPLLDHLTALHARHPFIVSQRSVPGLWAFLLDLPALRAAFDDEAPSSP